MFVYRVSVSVYKYPLSIALFVSNIAMTIAYTFSHFYHTQAHARIFKCEFG